MTKLHRLAVVGIVATGLSLGAPGLAMADTLHKREFTAVSENGALSYKTAAGSASTQCRGKRCRCHRNRRHCNRPRNVNVNNIYNNNRGHGRDHGRHHGRHHGGTFWGESFEFAGPQGAISYKNFSGAD
jgi:hypothetical protein